MKQYLWKNKKRPPFTPLLFVIAVFCTASSFGAVLNPFPSPERVPMYQQVAPRSRQPQTRTLTEFTQFKRDVRQFSCAEIDTLYNRLQRQLNAAVTAADRNYYNGFLNILRAEKTRKCKK